MNILKNRTLLGLACIVLSLVICFGLTPMFSGAVQAQVEIVRMVKDVRQGEMITADMVAAVKVGGHNLPDSVLRQQNEAVGKYAKYDMQSGDYILSGKVSDVPLTEFAYLHELDGSRLAISITIKSFAGGLSGKLESGDIIGVIATDVGNFRETVVPPELRYVRVIAVTDGKGYDKEYNDNSDDEKQLPSTVTLLVLPEQAKTLAELESAGRIHLTLIYRGLQKNADKFIQIQDDYINSLQEETNELDDIDETDIVINNIDTANDTDKINKNAENPANSGETETNEPQEEESGGTKIIMPDGREVIIGG